MGGTTANGAERDKGKIRYQLRRGTNYSAHSTINVSEIDTTSPTQLH
jgi:N-acetylmuramoyl-L-alanine amidase CwlA